MLQDLEQIILNLEKAKMGMQKHSVKVSLGHSDTQLSQKNSEVTKIVSMIKGVESLVKEFDMKIKRGIYGTTKKINEETNGR
tara:strand:- start:543 stop:788 length:246 start_codon:yes stop_codon:yes gene_type:complete